MGKCISIASFCLLLLFPSVSLPQGTKFVLLSSTISPIDAGKMADFSRERPEDYPGVWKGKIWESAFFPKLKRMEKLRRN